LQYQKSFNNMLERLKINQSVLAVMVFGSMVTGDLWEESDIDLFVITQKDPLEIVNLYTEEQEITIHIKLMSKKKFMQLHESDLRGGFIHRIFASSRLVFSKDMDITTRYNNGRYYPDNDRNRWNLVYLGRVLKSISSCKKNLNNHGIITAYCLAVRSLEDFARLFLNSSGYMISKDVVTMAMDLNDQFKTAAESLLFEKDNIKAVIANTINYLQLTIDENIKIYTALLLNYMKLADGFLSAEDVKKDKLFTSYDIEVEEIFRELWSKNIIKKEEREFKSEDGSTLIKENVYFI
jgi:uncharacterized protein